MSNNYKDYLSVRIFLTHRDIVFSFAIAWTPLSYRMYSSKETKK